MEEADEGGEERRRRELALQEDRFARVREN
jgi:hypothetical protein